jgi:hypothetical protein
MFRGVMLGQTDFLTGAQAKADQMIERTRQAARRHS